MRPDSWLSDSPRRSALLSGSIGRLSPILQRKDMNLGFVYRDQGPVSVSYIVGVDPRCTGVIQHSIEAC